MSYLWELVSFKNLNTYLNKKSEITALGVRGRKKMRTFIYNWILICWLEESRFIIATIGKKSRKIL